MAEYEGEKLWEVFKAFIILSLLFVYIFTKHWDLMLYLHMIKNWVLIHSHFWCDKSDIWRLVSGLVPRILLLTGTSSWSRSTPCHNHHTMLNKFTYQLDKWYSKWYNKHSHWGFFFLKLLPCYRIENWSLSMLIIMELRCVCICGESPSHWMRQIAPLLLSK